MSNITTQATPETLVRVFPGTIGGVPANVCDARELHTFLQSGDKFADWIKARIEKYGFEENRDFALVSANSETKKGRGGDRRSRDYHLSLDMAKELSMVENNEQGRTARRYFIDMERKALEAAGQPAVASHLETLLGSTIGTNGFNMLGAIIKGKVAGLPKEARRSATMKIWSQTHTAFGVRSASDIPADQLDAARNFVAAYAVEGEFLGREEPKPERLAIDYPLSWWDDRKPGQPLGCLDIAAADLPIGNGSPCLDILDTLRDAGYTIDAAFYELRTYQNLMFRLQGTAHTLAIMAERAAADLKAPQRYSVNR